jgi:hypothetical protein
MLTVGWTGHRPGLFADPAAARQTVFETARATEAKRYVVGGQRGVDTWAAQAAIELKVPFTLLLPLPVPEFTIDWLPADRDILEQQMALADEVRIVGGYTERNRLVASSCELLIAVWTGRVGGGTAETIGFARQFGTPVAEIHLAAPPGPGCVTGRGI